MYIFAFKFVHLPVTTLVVASSSMSGVIDDDVEDVDDDDFRVVFSVVVHCFTPLDP